MKFRYLGNSGLLVSELCLGTMIFGEDSSRGTDQKTATQIVHKFLDAGGNFIDTADEYVGGRSEEIVGEAIKKSRDQVILATKVRFATGPLPNDAGLSRHHIVQGVEASLQRLQTDVIDVLYAHTWDPITPLEETLRAFDDLIASGKVRYLGVSNFKAWQLMKALATSDSHGWSRFVAAQYQYSLVERNIEDEISDLCESEGLGLTPWGPLGGGFLSGKYQPGAKPGTGRLSMMPEETEEAWHRRSNDHNWKILKVVDEISKARQATYSQISLAWLLQQAAVSSVIIGVRTLPQLEDNTATIDLALSEQEVRRLNQVSTPELRYPYGYLENYSSRNPNPEF